VNEDNLDLFKDLRRDTGLRLVTLVPNLFYGAEFEFGSLSSPDPRARKLAIERTTIVWPGIDGFDNTFGQNHVAARDRFAEGLAEAMDAVPGVRVVIEPKPYEPRPTIMYGTTAEALLLCAKVESLMSNKENTDRLAAGTALLGLNPEVGHMLMAYEDLAYAFSLVCEYGRLGHTHWNSQPMGNYDQDLNVGVVYPEQTEAALYALKMCGYDQHHQPRAYAGRARADELHGHAQGDERAHQRPRSRAHRRVRGEPGGEPRRAGGPADPGALSRRQWAHGNAVSGHGTLRSHGAHARNVQRHHRRAAGGGAAARRPRAGAQLAVELRPCRGWRRGGGRCAAGGGGARGHADGADPMRCWRRWGPRAR